MDRTTSHSLPWTEDEYLAVGETLAEPIHVEITPEEVLPAG